MASVITHDAKWQICKNHKPCKESKWNHRPDEDGWMYAHNSLRGEINDINEAFDIFPTNFPSGAPLWAIEAIRHVWSHHEIHVHSHHANEDNIMVPYLKTRINLPPKMEVDHENIMSCMDCVKDATKNMKEGDSIDRVKSTFTTYKNALLPHLREEEQISLPLMMAYFEPKEIEARVREIMKSAPRVETGSFIYYMSEEAFRNKFMKQERIPSFLWYLIFKPRYNYFIRNMMDFINALKSGEELQRKTGCFF